MSTSPFSRFPGTDVFKDDVRSMAQDAARRAQEHLVGPAKAAAQDARHVAREVMDNASALASKAVGQARGYVNKQVDQAERIASHQWDRASNWISANPFVALGIAFGAGAVFSAISRFAGSRR